jgi:integrase/recombinase XerD
MYNTNEIEQKFKQHLGNLGYTPNTVLMACAGVKAFLHHIATPIIENINQEQIQDYYEHLQNRKQKRKDEPLSEAYINHQVYSIKLFFTWLEQTHQIDENPISNIKFKRPKINTRQPLSKAEITELFNATQNLKEKTLLHLFYSCGLRRSEAVSLNMIDVDFGNSLLYVRDGKGAKRRVIPLNKIVKNDLENYCIEYRKDKDLEPFMLSRIKKRMLGDGYNRLLKELLKKTEITEEITLHHLRHSIATHLLENGMSIEFVRDFLGHSHLESTQIYAKVRSYQIKKL